VWTCDRLHPVQRIQVIRTGALTKQSTPFNGLINSSPAQRSLLLEETFSAARSVNQARFGYSLNRSFSQPADSTLNPSEVFEADGQPLPGFSSQIKVHIKTATSLSSRQWGHWQLLALKAIVAGHTLAGSFVPLVE
jgi:hypothetical protein